MRIIIFLNLKVETEEYYLEESKSEIEDNNRMEKPGSQAGLKFHLLGV